MPTNPIKHYIDRIKKPHFLIVSIVSLLIYAMFLLYVVQKKGWVTNTPYYSYLAQSFLDLKTNVNPPNNYDLSYVEGKRYMVWGPAGALGALPFYLLSGTQASDMFYTFFFAWLNVLLFVLLCSQLAKWHKKEISEFSLAALGIGFALVSPNFFLGVGGEIWFFCQIMSMFYFLSASLFAVQYLQNRKQSCLVWVAVLLCLSWLTRITNLVYLLFLLPLLWTEWKFERERILRSASLVLGVVLVSVGFCFIYNFTRFGSVFDFGYAYVIPKFAKGDVFLDWNILKENVNFYFSHHFMFKFSEPYSNYSNIGSSVPSFYPLLFGLFWFLNKETFTSGRKLALLGVVLVCILMESGIILLKPGFGWTQVGARYFYTVVTLLYLTLVMVSERIPKTFYVLALSYGFLVQGYCLYIFYTS